MILLACLEQPYTDLIQILMTPNVNQEPTMGQALMGVSHELFHLIFKSVS